jgi:hypothetical protein
MMLLLQGDNFYLSRVCEALGSLRILVLLCSTKINRTFHCIVANVFSTLLQVENDYLSPFLPPRARTGQLMTRQEMLEAREKCLRALKDRLIERANIIQVRLRMKTDRKLVKYRLKDVACLLVAGTLKRS